MIKIHTRKTCEKVALFKKKGEYHYTGLFLKLSLIREGLECTLNYSDYFLTGSGNAWQSSVPNSIITFQITFQGMSYGFRKGGKKRRITYKLQYACQ